MKKVWSQQNYVRDVARNIVELRQPRVKPEDGCHLRILLDWMGASDHGVPLDLVSVMAAIRNAQELAVDDRMMRKSRAHFDHSG